MHEEALTHRATVRSKINKKIAVLCGNVTCKSVLGLNNWN